MSKIAAMLQHLGDNASEFQTEYGNISLPASAGIQRALLSDFKQGAEQFFGEPMLNL